MRLPFQLLSLAAAILLPTANASSKTRNPISALSLVQNATIHTYNHFVTAHSNFELSFILGDDLHVKFSLEPNHDILPGDASISHLAPDGTITRKEKVDRLEHKVFKGTAWVQRTGIDQSKWRNVGWARVMLRKDGKVPFFEGAFSVDRDYHHIQSSKNYGQTRHRLDPEIGMLGDDGKQYMIVWRDSDMVSESARLKHQELKRSGDEDFATCQADGLSFNTNPEHPVYQGMMQPPVKSSGSMDFSHLFGKRQLDTTTGGNAGGVNLASTIGDPNGCPTTRKVALVGVVTDCTYTSAFDNEQDLRQNVISQMNSASAVWENAFNISLGLQNLTISNGACPATPSASAEWNQDCSDSVNIQERLNMFSAWRGEQGGDQSHWTLLSTCNTGSAVGLAWLGQACVSTSISSNSSQTGSGITSDDGSETVTGANVVVRSGGANEWAVIAHETGHTFGAVHDCDSTACADADYVASQQCCPLSANECDASSRYIMNPYTEPGVNQFSPCTIGNICSAIGRKSVNTECLSDNSDVRTYTGQQCGNGIVEPGEDCDCGGAEGCVDDPCCNPETCSFNDGAVCDDANEDCCSSCQFMSQGTVCRPSSGDCDPSETCSGSTGTCPTDNTRPDGESCGDGLSCASGQCTSRDQQCKTVMGSYTEGNDTHACDSQGCAISCASPEFGYGVCYGLQQNFLDGTTCGGGGHCENGRCEGSSFGGEIGSWIDDHKEIVIGVCAGIGGLILISIISCCVRRCRRRRGRKQAPSPPPPGGWQGWNSRQPPQYGRMSQAPPPPGHGWYGQPHPQPHMSGARGGWDTPPPPPPTYQQNRNVYG